MKLRHTLNNAKLKVEKYSPEILMALGLAGFVSSLVLTVVETLNTEDDIKDLNKEITEIKSAKEKTVEQLKDNPEEAAVVTKESNKELIKVYSEGAKVLAKNYLPCVILAGASIVCVTQSHHILKQRNVALLAAYTTLNTSYLEYRKNVKERYGEEIDKQMYYGTDEITVTDEKGKETKIVTHKREPKDYDRIFDETNVNFVRQSDYNAMFIKQAQNWANKQLKERGHLFLNDVYRNLGFDEVPEGQLLGWIHKPGYLGNNEVDFGLFDSKDQDKMDFLNGIEPAVILSFNYTGIILNEI